MQRGQFPCPLRVSEHRWFVLYHAGRLLAAHHLLTHAIAGTFPHLFHIAHGLRAEEILLFAGEVGGVTIAHTNASASCVESLADEHQAASLLEPQVLLKLQRAHRGKRLEVLVEA